MKKTISVPEFDGKKWTTRKVSYDVYLASYKKSLKNLPPLVSVLKHADNAQWQRVYNDLTLYIQKDKQLSKLIRPNMINGEGGISVGEPNWAGHALGAFCIGYATGSALYKAGYFHLV